MDSYSGVVGNIYEFRRQILRLPNANGLTPIGFPLSLPLVQQPEHDCRKFSFLLIRYTQKSD